MGYWKFKKEEEGSITELAALKQYNLIENDYTQCKRSLYSKPAISGLLWGVLLNFLLSEPVLSGNSSKLLHINSSSGLIRR
ncbi:hypothetical protein [Microbulbifer sp. JMSA002]|uniref:hypothetical protein n=1 Tax=Microbulbifer sp. JMSA002 TaxID=3243368 RepID=UPI004039FBFD